jgi:endoglucanase
MRRTRLAAGAALALTLLARPSAGATAPLHAPTMPRPLHVTGNRLVDDAGQVVQLRGVNRSSPETLCQATGRISFFYGATDAATVAAIRSWGANAVRIPVNEDCWLGRNGLPASLTATAYRTQLATYVRLVEAAGLYAIVDVHFAETTGVGGLTLPSTGPAPMLDRAHGLELWRSIVATFRADTGVLYDLYNEPHDVDWTCWRDGCVDAVTGSAYLGIAEIVNAVRAAGATTPLILTGPSWGNEISKWLYYAPPDPLHRLVAGVHAYAGSGCADLACREERIKPVAASVPVVFGEFGDLSCAGSYLGELPAWADPLGISYLAFTWNTPDGPCPGYHLIASFDGTPTQAGAVYRSHLLAVAPKAPKRLTASVCGTAYCLLPSKG